MIDSSLLLSAYAQGYFPMAEPHTGEIQWYSPDPRAIIPLESFNIPRSLQQVIRKHLFQIRINSMFEEVIRSCARREETWISEDIVQSYCRLHRMGYAHSVEAWKGNALRGGLYGVAIGGAFFGESMFSISRDASKVALVALVDRLKEKRFGLLDTQFITPHLARFGTFEIPREEYIKLLHRNINEKRSFLD
jgi:leucyl/phenylalanyl-tRNA--protein transferase